MIGRASLVAFGAAVALAGTVEAAGAVPAYPDARITLEQPSGEEFKAGLHGDEWSGGYETLDGYAIEQDHESERWEFAKRASNGRLVAGGTAATKPAPPGLDRDLQESPRHRVSRASEFAEQAPNPPNTGTQRSIVILAQFNNQATLGTTPSNWSSRYFGTSDSVSDYYDEVSFGQLDIAPGVETDGTANDGVVGWLDINSNHPGSTPGPVIDSDNQAAFDAAVVAANQYVDYSSFDADGDGVVSPHELHITVITAGYEASTCGPTATSTWGHKWGIGNPSTVDGVTVPEYTMFGEHHCPSQGNFTGTYMATLGIMVHEIGHDIDMPDLYDVDSTDPGDTGADGDGGTGLWTVMSLGSFGAEPGELPGETPPHPDPFLKSYQGWLNPTVATGTQTQNLDQAATSADALQVLDNPNGVDWTFSEAPGTGEYFLIENRQNVGYDASIPGCGLLIWHIDETRPTNNTGNATDVRRHVDLEEADNGAASTINNPAYSAFDPGDAWLAGTFGPSSAPNSNLYDSSASGVSVSNISSVCAATMSATVTGPGGGGGNIPPVLGAIGSKSATVGNQLSFQVSATDADADDLGYSASNLPAGATFDPGTRTFSWTPTQAGTHPNVHFEVTDGTDSDSENITITVTAASDTDPPETTILAEPPKKTVKVKKGKAAKFVYEYGSDENPVTYECNIDGDGFEPCFQATRFTLPKGTWTLEARAVDAAGNFDATPVSDTVKVKTKKKRR